MKQARIFGGAFLAMGLLAGCQTAQEVNDEYEKYAKESPAAEVIVSGDKAIDAIAVASARVSEQTNQMLKEYVAKTNVKYRHFCGAMQQKMEDQKMSEAEAFKAIRNEYMATDAGKAEWKDVEVGIKAVNALKPEQKLATIVPLLASSQEIVKNATSLKGSFNGFDPSSMKKAASVMNVIEQADNSRKALNFLQRFYTMNAAIPKSN